MILQASLVKDNPDSYALDFQYTIAKVCVQLGCKLPSKDQFTVLLEFHVKFFNYFTFAEIKAAFELLLLGEVKDENGGKIIHYQNFDCDYYSTVMRSYGIKKQRVTVNSNMELSKLEFEERNRHDNEQAHRNILRQIVDDFSTKTPQIFAIKYDILEETGVIKLKTEEKNRFMELARVQIKDESVKNIDIRTIKDLTAGVIEADVKSTAKKLAYKEFISNPDNLTKLQEYISEA